MTQSNFTSAKLLHKKYPKKVNKSFDFLFNHIILKMRNEKLGEAPIAAVSHGL